MVSNTFGGDNIKHVYPNVDLDVEEPMTKQSIEQILDKFTEETEDLWEQFMEGDNPVPDPDKYKDFYDRAKKEAKTAIGQLMLDIVGEDEKPDMWIGANRYAYSNKVETRNNLRAELRHKIKQEFGGMEG